MRVNERVSSEDAKPAELWWTGERLMAGVEGDRALQALHQYAIASALVPGQKVLDVACGEGYGARLLAQYAEHVTGVDLSSRAVQQARVTYPRPNLDFRIGNCANLPLDSASVDTVVSVSTLECLDLQREMLSEICRVLRPGGLLIISTALRQDETAPGAYQDPFHVKELSETEFRALLASFFRNSAVYHQHCTGGSLVVPADDRVVGGVTVFRGNYGGLERKGSGTRPSHLLGLASDGELPALPWGFFQGDGIRDDKELHIAALEEMARERLVCRREEESHLSRREQELGDREAETARREQAVQRREQAVADREHANRRITESWSWRMTAPLRATLDLTRRLLTFRE